MKSVTPLRDRASLEGAARRAYDEIAARRGAVGDFYGLLLHVPELARRIAAVSDYLRFESDLDPGLRYTVSLTVAHALGCTLVLEVNTREAIEAGVPASAVAQLREGRAAAELGERGAASHALARGLLARVAGSGAPDDGAPSEALDEREVVELVAIASFYLLVANVVTLVEP